ncbi:MAG TPA: hypothetical protein VE974_04705 [Thermoanaerobaculia bacterium]|nr:hypothetical protein [Thermoanaerobaculia bacterium]
MTAPVSYDRYPGARSFADSDLDRRLFRGRSEDTDALLHLILVERLVVLYGRSGMGKTSLLNAGVAARLREQGFFPMVARMNDPARGPFQTVIECVQQSAADSRVELIAPDGGSLWQFFRSAELWKGDELLTPVLILDQFEELFTIHEPAQRQQFIDELGALVRGSSAEGRPSLGDFRTVISIREDFLGHLEELSARIPNILHKRFRVSALSRVGAEKAIVEPAAVADPGFASPAFTYEAGTLEGLLNFLSARAASRGPGEHDLIDPFQLQLVCQHVESVVRSRNSVQPIEVKLDDLGGESGLRQMLRTFYVTRTSEVVKGFARQRVERLIEQGLISAQGRRLSLEEGDIQQRFRVSPAVLGRLVAVRLLRADTRIGSIYYEISHDTLVAPIVAARQAKAKHRRRRIVAGIVVAACLFVVAVMGLVERALEDLDLGMMNVLSEGVPSQDDAQRPGTQPVPILAVTSFDGDTVAKGFGNGSVRVTIRHRGHNDVVLSDRRGNQAVSALSFDPFVHDLAIGRSDGSVEIRSLETFAEQSAVPTQGFAVSQIILNLERRMVAFLGDDQFRLFDWSERRARPVMASSLAMLSMSSLVAFDGDLLLFLDAHGRLRCLRVDGADAGKAGPCE